VAADDRDAGLTSRPVEVGYDPVESLLAAVVVVVVLVGHEQRGEDPAGGCATGGDVVGPNGHCEGADPVGGEGDRVRTRDEGLLVELERGGVLAVAPSDQYVVVRCAGSREDEFFEIVTRNFAGHCCHLGRGRLVGGV